MQPASNGDGGRHRVVVVGGGFGGLNVTRALADADVDVTRGGPDQPPPVPAAALPGRDRHPAARPDRAGAAPRPGQAAQRPRPARRRLRHRPRRPARARPRARRRTLDLPYDTLVVAAGATHSYFGKPEFAEYAPGMKTIEDARLQRDAHPGEVRDGRAGDRPAGAGRVADLRGDRRRAHRGGAGRPDRRAGPHRAAPRLPLGGHPQGADHPARGRPRRPAAVRAEAAALHPAQLEAMGVEVRTNSLAVDMDHDSVTIKGPDGLETIRARTRIWAAGVQASPLATLLAKQVGVEPDRAGRVPVEPRLHAARAPRGVRDRRHGVAEQAARGGPARPAGGQVRRQGDQGPAGRGARAGPVQVLRQGHHGHHRLQGRRRRRVPRQGHRPDRLPHVAVHPRHVPGRLGQPDRHRSTPGRGRSCSPAAGPTGSSPTRTRAPSCRTGAPARSTPPPMSAPIASPRTRSRPERVEPDGQDWPASRSAASSHAC